MKDHLPVVVWVYRAYALIVAWKVIGFFFNEMASVPLGTARSVLRYVMSSLVVVMLLVSWVRRRHINQLMALYAISLPLALATLTVKLPHGLLSWLESIFGNRNRKRVY